MVLVLRKSPGSLVQTLLQVHLRLVAPVTALEVYPNPSRDIFNVSFTSEEVQTINVKVVNVIEVVYTENLEEFTVSTLTLLI